LLIQRRQTRKSLAVAQINEAIVERYYQTRAIRRIGEAFEKDHDRKTLIVMATGAGKTRTIIALCDLLMRCNWAKRVLFLCDRVALVNQAVNAFKKHLPESSPVNLVTEKETEGRVFVSTYPTMMGLIDETNDGQRRFGVGHFDLIIIDEAHRSVYQKYKAIFDYFDSLLVGLTATPREEIDRDTYGLFNLEKGVPTDSYDLNEAVADKFLVPAQPVNNWNLVDGSAPYIVGAHLLNQGRSLLYELAKSRSLWDRRISILATLAFIRADDFTDTLKLTEQLLGDEHDLMHKACGWMLREVGNRNQTVLEGFLRQHHDAMPRTMLRYAIERFSPAKRTDYLTGKIR
jgi:hypothetical protein